MQELITIKQLPQIEEHLKELSIEIDKKVKNAKSLVCTEENVCTAGTGKYPQQRLYFYPHGCILPGRPDGRITASEGHPR